MASKDLLARIEAAYNEAKDEEAESLHNDLAQVLAEHGAHIQASLYALEMLRAELLHEKLKTLFSE